MVGGQGVLSHLERGVACLPGTRSGDTDLSDSKWCRRPSSTSGRLSGRTRRIGKQVKTCGNFRQNRSTTKLPQQWGRAMDGRSLAQAVGGQGALVRPERIRGSIQT